MLLERLSACACALTNTRTHEQEPFLTPSPVTVANFPGVLTRLRAILASISHQEEIIHTSDKKFAYSDQRGGKKRDESFSSRYIESRLFRAQSSLGGESRPTLPACSFHLWQTLSRCKPKIFISRRQPRMSGNFEPALYTFLVFPLSATRS